MAEDKIRVLHYIKHLEYGGGEMLLYNLYQHMDRNRIQFDFLVNTDKEEALDKKMKILGSEIIPLMKKEPRFIPWKIIKSALMLKKLLQEKKYKIIHIHASNGQGLAYAHIARKAKVPVVIVHAHNSDVDGSLIFLKKKIHELFKKMYLNDPTDYFACSKPAAQWLFSEHIAENKCFYLKNGIDITKFKFNSTVRDEMRKELDVKNQTVILNIGRMEIQKNQQFLIEIFGKICSKSDNYVLVIVGKGTLKHQIQKKADALGITDKIIFVDHTFEIEKYMFASDLFILPSLYEGLGIAAIEAQAAGLPTVISDGVPKEVAISNLVLSIPLSASVDVWAKKIMKIPLNDKREAGIISVKKAEYDIAESAEKLEKFYMNKNDFFIGRNNNEKPVY